jgi:lipoate-protein ligase A
MNPGGRDSLRDRLIRNLRRYGPPALVDLADGEPQARVDGDERLVEAMLAGALPPRLQRIWTNRPCIVATRAQARLPGFARAATSGLPVAIRLSAGSAVVHHQDTLQISLVERMDVAAIDAGYRRLIDLMASALAPLGIRAMPSAIEGAYCDGRFNLCAAGRKIGGTAAFLRSRKGRAVGLFHACLTLSGDTDRDVACVARFERALGLPGRYDAASHASVLASLTADDRAA